MDASKKANTPDTANLYYSNDRCIKTIKYDNDFAYIIYVLEKQMVLSTTKNVYVNLTK